MNEKEFDISVRNLLQDAEMPVSPKVWKGVSASLGGGAKVFSLPVWAYALSGVAVAAAVALGVFLFKPSDVAPVQHRSLTAQVSEINTAPVSATVAVPVRKNRPVAVNEPAAVEKVEAFEVEDGFISREVPSIVRAGNPVSHFVQDDFDALNRLAYTEKKSTPAVSILASGDFQNNSRKPFSRSIAGIARAPQTPDKEGIYNATPEVAFGMPMAFGIGAKFTFTDRLAVATGIRYTWFSRTFVGDYYDSEGFPVELLTDIDNYQHWVGIPLNLFYDIVSTRYWHMHTFVGGSTEFLMDNDYIIHHNTKDLHYKDNNYPPLFSVGAGIGVEFSMSHNLGLYFDPSFRYYLNSEKAPRSIRTVQPLCIDFEAGLRFYFGN